MITVNLAVARLGARDILNIQLNVHSFYRVPDDNELHSDMKRVETQILVMEKAIEACKSDAVYWSLLSDKTYWEAVRNILEAGLRNKGLVVDVAAPDLSNCVIMDWISKVEKYGEEVLNKTTEKLV